MPSTYKPESVRANVLKMLAFKNPTSISDMIEMARIQYECLFYDYLVLVMKVFGDGAAPEHIETLHDQDKGELNITFRFQRPDYKVYTHELFKTVCSVVTSHFYSLINHEKEVHGDYGNLFTMSISDDGIPSGLGGGKMYLMVQVYLRNGQGCKVSGFTFPNGSKAWLSAVHQEMQALIESETNSAESRLDSALKHLRDNRKAQTALIALMFNKN